MEGRLLDTIKLPTLYSFSALCNRNTVLAPALFVCSQYIIVSQNDALRIRTNFKTQL